ncbi:MAG: pilus assembly protein N-terminal domain-containing protein [Phycisphaerales bacterium]|nr:pilus assembly protein N-terminal domain-containing protein [Phycisphaerales bacterium]MCB9862737.1 pilus assembly protein N-terminal domain-containing protein [Phycisphaerales bacterium]
MTATALLLATMLISPNLNGTTPIGEMREITPASAPSPRPESTSAQRVEQLARADRNEWDDFRDFPSRPTAPSQDEAAGSAKLPEIEPAKPSGPMPTKPSIDPVDIVAEPSATPQTRTPIDPMRLPAVGPKVVANLSSADAAGPTALTPMMKLTVDHSTTIELDKPVDAAGITDPEIADLIVLSPEKLMLVGKNPGATQLRLRTGESVSVHHIHVEPNTEVLNELIRSVAPSADVRVGAVKGQIVLSGRVSDVMDVTRIEDLAKAYQGGPVINHLNVAGVQQALLRVVVAEVNKDAARKLGVNWGFGASDLSRDVFFANNLGNINPTSYGSNGLPNVLDGQLNYSVAPTAIGQAANFTIGFPRAELQFFMNALRENSLGRTLAEPNLVAISGQTATFLAGGEVPIPVTQGGATAGAITLQYKEFGVRLAFTPTVIGGQLIRLHVMSEVSDAVPQAQQFNGLPTFSFQTRRVESTVECGNGQTFAMAGLLDDSIRAVSSKIPGLGDLPILGTLFSSVDYQRSKTELVVLVTPELVAPLDPGMINTYPGADISEPTDFELFMQQKLDGGPRASAPVTQKVAPDAYVGQPQRTVITAGDIGIEGPWGMTGD